MRAVVADLLSDEGVDVPAEVVLALVDGAVMAWLTDDAGDRPGALVARVSRALAHLASAG